MYASTYARKTSSFASKNISRVKKHCSWGGHSEGEKQEQSYTFSGMIFGIVGHLDR